jgi:hypothetical protein
MSIIDTANFCENHAKIGRLVFPRVRLSIVWDESFTLDFFSLEQSE